MLWRGLPFEIASKKFTGSIFPFLAMNALSRSAISMVFPSYCPVRNPFAIAMASVSLVTLVMAKRFGFPTFPIIVKVEDVISVGMRETCGSLTYFLSFSSICFCASAIVSPARGTTPARLTEILPSGVTISPFDVMSSLS